MENFEERGKRRRTSLQTTSSTIGRDLRCGQVCTLYGRVGGSYVPSHRDPHRHHLSPKTVLHPLREALSSGVRKNVSVSRECATAGDGETGGIAPGVAGRGRLPKFMGNGREYAERSCQRRKASNTTVDCIEGERCEQQLERAGTRSRRQSTTHWTAEDRGGRGAGQTLPTGGK